MPDTENPVRVHPALDKLTIRLDQLRPRKGNPRRGNIDAIAESLERNGQYRPVVVNKPNTARTIAPTALEHALNLTLRQHSLMYGQERRR